MMPQYTLPEVGKIFSLENRYQLMTKVTVTACEALADIGVMPREAYLKIKNQAGFDINRIEELEEECGHNTLAFITCLTERIDTDAARYVHLGLASADISDIATSLQACQVADLLMGRLDQLRKVMVKLAQEHKYTIMMGRTHGTHAEPITFGLKMAVWIKELDRSALRLSHARNSMAVGKVNGPVGTFASVAPSVEVFVCRRLGLHPAPVTTQIIQRDRLAEFITTLAIIGSSIEKFAVEIRTMQRTEIHEVEEFVPTGQSGSSSLPHKRRPYKSEVISGLSRVLRGNSLAAMEDIPVWGEQDASHSSVERIIMPDSCILLDYMLCKFTEVMRELVILPETMRSNIDKTFGLAFSQDVLLALLSKGVPRDKAFQMVRKNALVSWEQKTDFQFLLLQDQAIRQYLSKEEIMSMFDLSTFMKNIDYIFSRADI